MFLIGRPSATVTPALVVVVFSLSALAGGALVSLRFYFIVNLYIITFHVCHVFVFIPVAGLPLSEHQGRTRPTCGRRPKDAD